MIDTPGHVDFNYEVEKSLQACEGAILLVDASQGVEAQTVANAYLAVEADLEIVPVLNKIDLAHARPGRDRRGDREQSSAIDGHRRACTSPPRPASRRARRCSTAIVEQVPPPKERPEAPLRALIFDAVYDEYRGIIVYLRVVRRHPVQARQDAMMGTGKVYEAVEIGHLHARA